MLNRFKRFYQEAAAVSDDAGHGVLLDGRPLRTPAKAPLRVPSRPLAAALAGEWAAQQELIRPQAMPLTGMACSAIDYVGPQRRKVVGDLATYAEHDLVCYWAEGQPELAERQQAAWQPLLDWAALTFDAPLTTTRGVVPLAQPPAAVAALGAALGRYDDMTLAALSVAVQAAGSLVIAVALTEGRIEARAAFESSQLDELYQAEKWGEDKEAAARRAVLREELAAAERFLALLREGAA